MQASNFRITEPFKRMATSSFLKGLRGIKKFFFIIIIVTYN